ncbi:AAA family ATPase [Propionimicrobium sp. BV2F7]|uniref:AAA family ATPase n=1 Tax=Propionimicrobium TaxID=203133 RepID=UPI0018CC20D1|nr:AAA family ATPase [Propionimicrobium sp. BV2F7]
MTNIIDRPRYIERIMPHADTPTIKVLTGVRRCGKSTTLKLIEDEIRSQRPEAAFVKLNLESIEGISIRTPDELISTLTELAPDKSKRTFFS